LAVLKEQVHQDNLKRQRLLKRFADNPQPRAPSRAQRRDRPQAFPRPFTRNGASTFQIASTSSRAETVANPHEEERCENGQAHRRLTPTATLIYFVHIRRHATDLSDSDSQATILTYSRPA